MIQLLILVLVSVIIGLGLSYLSVKRTLQMLDEQGTPLRDAALQPYLIRLARALDLPALSVNVLEIAPINGLAAPDGRIYLTRGFLEKYRAAEVSAEELAGVIAHELGHVALGHTRRRIIDVTGRNAFALVLQMVLGRFIPIFGIYLANLIANFAAAHLSRRDEHEADAFASALLVKSGIGTAPQKSLFRKLDRLTGQTGTPPAWMLSHPPTAERIAAIEAREARWAQPARPA